MRLVKDRTLHVWESDGRDGDNRHAASRPSSRSSTGSKRRSCLRKASTLRATNGTRQAARGTDARSIDHYAGAVDELDVQGILAFAECMLPRASELRSTSRSITSSGCSSCSFRKESRTTEIDSIEPLQRHHFQLLAAVREC